MWPESMISATEGGVPVSTVEMPKRHRSVSQLSSLTSCGRAYEIERVEGHWGPPAAWTVKGIVVHEILDRWEKHRRAASYDFLQDFEYQWDIELNHQMGKWPDLSKWTRTPNTRDTSSDLKLRYRDGREEVQKYIAWAKSEEHLWMPLEIDGEPAVEVPFEVQLPGLDFSIRGYIDKMNLWSNGMVEVDDMKTGSDKRQNWRQLGMYKVAAKIQYGIDITHGRYIYTKLSRASAWKDLSIYTPEYLAGEYRKLDQVINSGLFLANPSLDGCRFCGVREFCKENPL